MAANNNIVNLIPALQPGVVYLTIGTAQQVKFICELLEVVQLEVLFEPTTQTIRRALGPRFTNDLTAVIIQPASFNGTGNVNQKQRSKDYGTVKSNGQYDLPNDSTFTVDLNTFAFICLLEQDNSKPSSIIKSLEGGYYQELDLRNIEFIDLLADRTDLVNQQYPYSSLYRINYETLTGASFPRNEIQKYNECSRYIEALTTAEGHKTWSKVSSADYHRLFKPVKRYSEQVQYPILLIGGRAYCLYLYLKPILDKVRDGASPRKLFGLFATWIYLCNSRWSDDNYYGFIYEPPKGKRNGYWKFKPSIKARMVYQSWFDCNCYRLSSKL